MINSAIVYKLPHGDTEVVLCDTHGGTVELIDLFSLDAEIIAVLHDYAVRRKDHEDHKWVEHYSLFFGEAQCTR